jgi:hypothetical protein
MFKAQIDQNLKPSINPSLWFCEFRDIGDHSLRLDVGPNHALCTTVPLNYWLLWAPFLRLKAGRQVPALGAR